MSNPLPLIVTEAGRAALVNADNDGTAPVLVSHIGVTDQAFTATTSTAAVPGELKQLTTFSGQVTADNIIHVIIRDDSADTYSLRGIGLYLDDGTLFASYGQADVIMEKSAAATLLLATDTIFTDVDATNLTFGDTNFLNPAATTEVQGVVELADDTEAKAGTDGTRAMTPAATTAALDQRLGAGAPSSFIKTLLTKASAAALWLALGIKSAAGYDTGEGKGLDADKLDGQHGAYYRRWDKLTGVPASFPPSSHTHAWSQITDKPAEATRWAAWGEVTDKPDSFPPSSHSHAMSEINGLATALAGKMPKTWKLTAGAGLTGGGTGSASRTVRLGVPSTITGSTANDASGDTHTHEVNLAASDIGLDRVDNTADLEKPISNAAQAALDTCAHLANAQTFTGLNTFAPGGGGNGLLGGGDYHSAIFGKRAGTGVISSILLSPQEVSTGTGVGLQYNASAGKYGIRRWSGSGVTNLLDINVETGAATYAGSVSAPSYRSAASDPRYKHSIAPCRYGLDEVMRMDFIEFRYVLEISADQSIHFGGRTDNLREVAPLLVHERDDEPDTTDYTQWPAVIGKALQEYVTRTDATIARLEARVAELEAT